MSNDKLSKKNREKLLIESEIHLGEVINSLKGTQEDLIEKGVFDTLFKDEHIVFDKIHGKFIVR